MAHLARVPFSDRDREDLEIVCVTEQVSAAEAFRRALREYAARMRGR
jgi:hypothetical protein